jgi:hypothetical protein
MYFGLRPDSFVCGDEATAWVGHCDKEHLGRVSGHLVVLVVSPTVALAGILVSGDCTATGSLMSPSSGATQGARLAESTELPVQTLAASPILANRRQAGGMEGTRRRLVNHGSIGHTFSVRWSWRDVETMRQLPKCSSSNFDAT